MRQRSVEIPAPPARLGADFTIPDRPSGVVLFAHGSGSSRFSKRNRHVANRLNAAGFATLLLDLLTVEEELNRANVFEIGLLTERLVTATNWVRKHSKTEEVPVGFFGASTGSAAALCAAAELGNELDAVVSRGGRPDLAGEALWRVTAPTLLIVGGSDLNVLALNEEAAARLRCRHEIAVVPGASHLFEEPGALDRVGELAAAWFSDSMSEARI
ncbi:MAG: dienelactone hydrolase family protein [Thermoleophilia bacterium]|nr:dienelactone hydrolase family protein [Thermoleophilia bacterium]